MATLIAASFWEVASIGEALVKVALILCATVIAWALLK